MNEGGRHAPAVRNDEANQRMNNDQDLEGANELTRAEFLRLAGMAALGAVAAGSLGGCGLFDDSEARVGSLRDLKSKGYLTANFNDTRIFTALDAEGTPYTLSLICTHKQCTVGYQPEKEEFLCPCHKGRYTKGGEVIEGKPPEPLHRFATEVRGGEVWVLNHPPLPKGGE
jgi:cytochrome b6-f complex iron-sulfur subunit